MINPWTPQLLPGNRDLETIRVLKSLPSAHAALAELKGIATTIPNQQILINALALQEAKDSSAIENIITTHDDLYKSALQPGNIKSFEAKEVRNYNSALQKGFALIKEYGFLSNRIILEIQQELEQNNAGYRKMAGTTLINEQTGEIIYTPTQDHQEIQALMKNLEDFINIKEFCNYDPLVKMAIIHFQFESIHPFYDGNGRTGRIINILYLILEGLQNLPILYLSSYIIKNKSEYYRLLQAVREPGDWEDWILYMIQGVAETAKETIEMISRIKQLMVEKKHTLKTRYKFYSQDLLNNLFAHPYTKIEFLMNDLNVTRLTASNYLNKLAEDGFLTRKKLGTGNYYINQSLFDLLSKRSENNLPI